MMLKVVSDLLLLLRLEAVNTVSVHEDNTAKFDTAYIGYGVLEFLGAGTTFDIFKNLHILYLQYGVLSFSRYGVLSLFPLWSLVSPGADTPCLP
ncbi:hypothetical protein Tco_1207720 [Tanacetum coccineum]